jgi:hypothetical protein
MQLVRALLSAGCRIARKDDSEFSKLCCKVDVGKDSEYPIE